MPRSTKELHLIRDLEEFLYLEASYLDKPDLDAWIDLYTEDGTYWMPAIENQEDPVNHVSLMYDDRVLMEIRKRNFIHPRAASKDYIIRASHLISNIRLMDFNEQTGHCTVTSNFHCASYYWDKQTLYAGTYQHDLIQTDNGFRIKQKRVDLINCDGVLGSIIIYI